MLLSVVMPLASSRDSVHLMTLAPLRDLGKVDKSYFI